MGLLQSGNAGDFDDDLASAEPRQYSTNSIHSSKRSEHLQPIRIERYPSSNDLLFNQPRKEQKNSNTNTGTSTVENLNLSQKGDKSDALTKISPKLVLPTPDISQKSENNYQVASSTCTDEFANDLPSRIQNEQSREISSAENTEIETSTRHSWSKRNPSTHPLSSTTEICDKEMPETFSGCESQVEYNEQLHPGHASEFFRINERRKNGFCCESRFSRHSELKFCRANKSNVSKLSEKVSHGKRKKRDPRKMSRTVTSEEKQNIICSCCDPRNFSKHRLVGHSFLNNKKRTTIDSWINMASKSRQVSKHKKSLPTSNDTFSQHSSGKNLLKRLVFVKNLHEAGRVVKKRKGFTSTNTTCKKLSTNYLPIRCVKESRGRFKSLGMINRVPEKSPKIEERLIFGWIQ